MKKSFQANKEEHLEFYFEGIYRNANVFINGKEAGGAAYGYIPFSVCADEYLINGENVITVTVDNSQCPNSRWYSGSGIYRPVWMYRGGKNHISRNGIKITTQTGNPAKVLVEVDTNGGEVRVEPGRGARTGLWRARELYP